MAEKWLFNTTIELVTAVRTVWDINFVSNASSFASIVSDDQKTQTLLYDDTTVYNGATRQWVDEAYRTVIFATAPSGSLLTWLQANAVKQATKAVNKVVVDGVTRLDLTGDSVTPQTLLAGATAHNAAGEQIEGAVTVAPAANYRRFEGTIESTVTGSGTSVLLVEDEIIGQVSELDSLLVRLSTDFAGDDAYTLLGCTAANALHVISLDRYQFLHRIGATAGVYDDRSAGSKPIGTTSMSVGQLIIRGNQLKWYVGSVNYAARPCNYVVEVMW